MLFYNFLIFLGDSQELNTLRTKMSIAPEYPNIFLCPITCDIMLDPVSATDGHTYERSAIQRWFDDGKLSSPITNVGMPSTDLVPNHAMKSQISSWREQNEGDVAVDNQIKVRPCHCALFAYSSWLLVSCLTVYFLCYCLHLLGYVLF